MPDMFMQNSTNALQKTHLCHWAADSKSSIHFQERKDRWGHGGLLLGGVTTKPAPPETGLIWCLVSVPLPHVPPPPAAGAGMPSETWGQGSFLSSHAPLEAEHLVPKEGRGSYRGGGGRNDPLSHSSSGCQPLIPGSHFFPLFPPSPPPSIPLLFCRLALSCQTEKWQARQRSSAWGDGQERTGAFAHKCINGAYFRQHLSNWEHVVTLNIFSLFWLHIQMHLSALVKVLSIK